MREIVVTGGGTGIGHAVAAAFAAQGDRVTITGRREHVLKEAADRLGGPDRVNYVTFNAANPVAVGESLHRLPARVDVLVNNAGGNTNLDRAPAEDDLMDVAESWWANLNANLMSAVLVTTALIPGSPTTPGSSPSARSPPGARARARTARPRPPWRRGPPIWPPNWARAGSPSTWSPRPDRGHRVLPGPSHRGGHTAPGGGHQERARRDARGRGGDGEVRRLPGARHITGQIIHVNGGAYLGR
nr:hypothetical protein GCM10020093_091300 [Planobispora longispora]